MANRPIDWLVIQRSDGPNEFTTVQSLYAVNNRDEVSCTARAPSRGQSSRVAFNHS